MVLSLTSELACDRRYVSAPPKDVDLREVFALDENGRIEIYGKNGSQTFSVPEAGLIADNTAGYVGTLKWLAGTPYVCGSGGQIYKQEHGTWTDIGFQRPAVDWSTVDIEKTESLEKFLDEIIANEPKTIMDITLVEN